MRTGGMPLMRMDSLNCQAVDCGPMALISLGLTVPSKITKVGLPEKEPEVTDYRSDMGLTY